MEMENVLGRVFCPPPIRAVNTEHFKLIKSKQMAVNFAYGLPQQVVKHRLLGLMWVGFRFDRSGPFPNPSGIALWTCWKYFTQSPPVMLEWTGKGFPRVERIWSTHRSSIHSGSMLSNNLMHLDGWIVLLRCFLSLLVYCFITLVCFSTRCCLNNFKSLPTFY